MKVIDKLLKVVPIMGILGAPLVLFGLALWKINTGHGDEGFGFFAGSLGFILYGAMLLRITQEPDTEDKTANTPKGDNEVRK